MDADGPPGEVIVHASCVAVNGRAALITGASGSGKSALALGLIARGAGLISDDRTRLYRRNGQVMAEGPGPIRGLIEARGLGILDAPIHRPAPVAIVIDLDRVEEERLPPARAITFLSVDLPLQYKVESPHFIDALLLYLRTGRSLR